MRNKKLSPNCRDLAQRQAAIKIRRIYLTIVVMALTACAGGGGHHGGGHHKDPGATP